MRPRRDWEELVRAKLAGLAMEPREKCEVIEELAAHLDETYLELRGRGFTEEDATELSLCEVKDWQDLRQRIQIARTKENIMTNRVKQFWLPSLVTILFTMGLLALIQIFGPNPWMVARHERNAWSLVAPVAVIYFPWLLSLPLVGALGAFLSFRSGGSQRAMFSCVVFPVLPYLVFFVVALPVMTIFNEHLAHNIMFGALFVGLFAWVLAPATALLAGGSLAKTFLSRRLDPRRIVSS